ncbi:MAG: MmcQ/YjbR family DNA-binding protein [Draconibacterium sp.]
MNIEEVREYCIAKKAVSESFPFNDTALVFKVMDKMFCILSLDDQRLSLKNDPEKNFELRSHYPAITEGYHLHKQQWNTIRLDGSVPPKLLKELIDDSYRLILEKIPKKKREGYGK